MALYQLPLAAGSYLLLLAVACAYDLRTRRIPNRVSLLLLLGGLAWMGYARGWAGAALALACGFGMVVLLWVPWTAGGIGGGDVKLAAAAIVWAGHELALPFVLVGAAAGGVVAALAYAASAGEARADMRRNLFFALIARSWPAPPALGEDGKKGRISVPYALAIMAGGIYIVIAPRFSWPH